MYSTSRTSRTGRTSMPSSLCFIKLLIFLATLLPCLARKTPPRLIKPSERQKFLDLAALAHDPYREEKVTTALKQAAGVYINEAKSKSLELESSVIVVTVFSDAHSKDILYNFLCFMQKYEIKVLVYHATETITFQYDFGESVTTLLFPIEDIWSTYAKKQMKYSNRDQWVQYDPELVIQNHGTGLKLFPLREIIQHNYNVIFFDLDMGFLYDPMPYLWQGLEHTPDVITSLEVIKCQAEPNNPPPNEVTDITSNGRATYMPNSGTLMVRSTEAGKAFLAEWMNATVEGNWYNEQYCFRWPNEYEMKPSESCNQLPNGVVSGSSYRFSQLERNISTDPSKKSLKFCFLNKYLFQTGMILFGCRYQSYYGNLSLAGIKETVSPSDNSLNPSYAYFPVNAHVNARTPKSFKTKKTTILKELNLWLYAPPPSSPSSSSSSSSPSTKTTDKRKQPSELVIAPAPAPKKPRLQPHCNALDVSKTRWATKRFHPMWHATNSFPADQT